MAGNVTKVLLATLNVIVDVIVSLFILWCCYAVGIMLLP